MAIVTIGIDLGKNLCSLAVLDEDGRVVVRKRIQRAKLNSYLITLPIEQPDVWTFGSGVFRHPGCPS